MDVISLKKLDLSKISFGEVQDKKVGNFEYKQIKIKRVGIDDEETLSDLLVRTREVFSFGVSEYKGDKYTSYSLPLCLYARDGPTEEEKAWVEKFEGIINKCEERVRKSKSLRKIGEVKSLYRQDGDPHDSPVLYAKLPCWKGKFRCKIYKDDKEIKPKTIIDKFCKVKSVLKIDSIMITDKIRLKVDLVCAKVTEVIESEEEYDLEWVSEDED